MKKQKQRVILTFIYVILFAVLVFNFSAIDNHLDMFYGLIAGVIVMTITNTLNDFESKKEEEKEFYSLYRNALLKYGKIC